LCEVSEPDSEPDLHWCNTNVRSKHYSKTWHPWLGLYDYTWHKRHVWFE
jgi:hypothetical protein